MKLFKIFEKKNVNLSPKQDIDESGVKNPLSDAQTKFIFHSLGKDISKRVKGGSGPGVKCVIVDICN